MAELVPLELFECDSRRTQLDRRNDGRFSSIKQYMRGKPHPWGFKIWACTGISGILCDFEVHQGRPKQGANAPSDLGVAADVVIKLSVTLPDLQHYKVFADNYFTSVPLVEKLADNAFDHNMCNVISFNSHPAT